MRGTRKSLEQTSSENYLNVTKNTTPTIRVSHLLAAASVSALAMALPGPVGVYGTRAWAQALPPGCEDETGDTTANDGEVIECEGDPTTGELDPVSTNVDDLTLIIGTDTDPVTIEAAPGSSQNGVAMNGSGPQTLTIRNAGTTVSGTQNGVSVQVQSGGAAGLDDLTIVSAGEIEGANYGIYTRNLGTGSTNITTSGRVEGDTNYGIESRSGAASTGVTINASGPVFGAEGAIDVYSQGGGDIHVEAGKLYSENGAGVQILAYPAANAASALEDVTIVLNDDVDAKTGVNVRHYGTGALQIDANKIDADDRAIYAYTYGTATSATFDLNAPIYGDRGVDIFHQGTGDATITLGVGASIAGKSGDRVQYAVDLNTTHVDADIYVQGTRDQADDLTGFIFGEQEALDLHTRGADISVKDLALVVAIDQNAIEIGSDGGDVTLSNIGAAYSEYGTAINVDSTLKSQTPRETGRGETTPVIIAGGDISIQNVAVSTQGPMARSAFGINVQSGPGNIYLGTDGQGGGAPLGDVQTSDLAINAYSTGGNVYIDVGGEVSSTNEAGLHARTEGVGNIRIVTRDTVTRPEADPNAAPVAKRDCPVRPDGRDGSRRPVHRCADASQSQRRHERGLELLRHRPRWTVSRRQ